VSAVQICFQWVRLAAKLLLRGVQHQVSTRRKISHRRRAVRHSPLRGPSHPAHATGRVHHRCCAATRFLGCDYCIGARNGKQTYPASLQRRAARHRAPSIDPGASPDHPASDHRPSGNVSGSAVRNRHQTIRDYFQKTESDLVALGRRRAFPLGRAMSVIGATRK
jgi:hypothetical protein